MLVISVVGNRPNFIKLAPVAEELDKRGHEHAVIHTGQHYDYNMSDIFFRELNIPAPKYNLCVGSGTHAEQTGKIMMALEPVLDKIDPEFVLVYGDTNTTLAAAITARKLGLLVGHVEAGCRCNYDDMPEEINRQIVDKISQMLFCPTHNSVKNLKYEGMLGHITGDVMVDVLRKIESFIPPKKQDNDYCVVTIHRAENTDDPEVLTTIFKELQHSRLPIVFPMHPRTSKVSAKYGIKIPTNALLTSPVSHIDMLSLIKHANVVLTDSGGIQKEAYLLNTPCITVRQTTEWPETIKAKMNVLINPDEISESINEMQHHRYPIDTTIFGDGNAAHKIVDIIEEVFM